MDTTIIKAEYLVQLATGMVTSEVREAYLSKISANRHTMCEIFEMIISSIFSGINQRTIEKEDAFNLIKYEYNAIPALNTYLGDFEKFENLINKLISMKTFSKDDDVFKILKDYITIAENLPEDFATPIYQGVLLKMINQGLLLNDLDYSQELIQWINENGVANEDRKLTALIGESLEFY